MLICDPENEIGPVVLVAVTVYLHTNYKIM